MFAGSAWSRELQRHVSASPMQRLLVEAEHSVCGICAASAGESRYRLRDHLPRRGIARVESRGWPRPGSPDLNCCGWNSQASCRRCSRRTARAPCDWCPRRSVRDVGRLAVDVVPADAHDIAEHVIERHQRKPETEHARRSQATAHRLAVVRPRGIFLTPSLDLRRHGEV